MNVAQRVARNVAFLVSSQVFIKIFNFIFTIFLARLIGTEGFGKYSFVAVLFGMLSLLANFGFESFIIRDIARDKSASSAYFWNSLLVKFSISLLILLAVSSLFGFTSIIDDPVKRSCIFISCFIMFFNCASQTMWSFTDANEKMQYRSLVNIFYNFGKAAVGLALIYMGYGLTIMFMGLLAVEIMVLIPAIIVTDKVIKIPAWNVDINIVKDLVRKSLPFALLGFLGLIYFRMDIFILSWLKGDEAVGWYNAAYGLLVGLLFIPDSLITALFPVMSRYHKDSEQALRMTYQKSIKYLLIMGLPMAAGIIILADKIILLFYGNEYVGSITALRILGIAVFFVFINAPLGRMLFSIDRQKVVLSLSLVTVAANIVLNLILIPGLSYMGSSIATVISEVLSSLIFFSLLARFSFKSGIFKVAVKPLAACLAMAIFIYALRQLNLAVLIVLGGCVYLIALFAIKTFDSEDEYLFKRIFKKAEQWT